MTDAKADFLRHLEAAFDLAAGLDVRFMTQLVVTIRPHESPEVVPTYSTPDRPVEGRIAGAGGAAGFSRKWIEAWRRTNGLEPDA